MPAKTDPFYVRYYSGHMGRYGHEFLEFEFSEGRLRYANNSNYRNDSLIRKEMWLSPLTISELKRIVAESEIIKEDDHNWPKKNVVGKQELEVRLSDTHISFETAKIGSLVDVQGSDDPEGLRVFYYLIQDLRIFVFSLISAHFKIKPVSLHPLPKPQFCLTSRLILTGFSVFFFGFFWFLARGFVNRNLLY
ncbi:hypothetical protein PGT21_024631 [Puccinia graminis f. sp. tritici]|uniref:Protein mago nashi n=1 Tax=Puccinia graminis f. sp. tritici TaxID=56615 RepID=A0A5B0PRX2_PUCGR|nr:hypothetical protein PGT21_024631 [Puccinia graminis f. sp. tritici]